MLVKGEKLPEIHGGGEKLEIEGRGKTILLPGLFLGMMREFVFFVDAVARGEQR